jgi:hypothetical protein
MVAVMSFSLSSGIIFKAVGLIFDAMQALDGDRGSSRHYREATAFIKNLKDALEPLQIPSLYESYPVYGEKIRQQLDKIKQPIDHFLELAGKFEADLGGTVSAGTLPRVPAKLKWKYLASEALQEVETELSGHMRVLHTMLLTFVV